MSYVCNITIVSIVVVLYVIGSLIGIGLRERSIEMARNQRRMLLRLIWMVFVFNKYKITGKTQSFKVRITFVSWFCFYNSFYLML